MDIRKEIKNSFKKGDVITKLIYINVAVFILVNLFDVFFMLFNVRSSFSLVNWLAVPDNLGELAYKPWSIITYMFLHKGFMHILFNLLWLFWLGRIFLAYFDPKKLLGVYLLGGLSGAVLYIFAFNVLPALQIYDSQALGASASVMAIVIAVSVFKPNYTINLLFIGPVKLIYLALVMLILDIIGMGGSNAGGHIAHLGGAVFGYFFASEYKKGHDITKGFNRFMDKLFALFKPKKKFKITYKRQKPTCDMDYNLRKKDNQAEIDRILDKISKSGYGSLTKKEKETLFRMSNKN